MTRSKDVIDVEQLFGEAEEQGWISKEAAGVLGVVPDIGAQIQAGLGVRVDDIPSSEVVLVTMLIDDSGSINSAGNEQVVRDGHNLVIDALLKSKQQENILVHVRYLNGKVLYPYCSLGQVTRMDRRNYLATGGTPLYDQSIVVLGTVLTKTMEFASNGVPVRSVTLIITDGLDQHSTSATASHVAKVVAEMLKMENHIIAAMGIDDGGTDYRKVFRAMGLRDEWVLTPANTPQEIRRAFNLFSQSATQASQSSQSFGLTSAGGFKN